MPGWARIGDRQTECALFWCTFKYEKIYIGTILSNF